MKKNYYFLILAVLLAACGTTSSVEKAQNDTTGLLQESNDSTEPNKVTFYASGSMDIHVKDATSGESLYRKEMIEGDSFSLLVENLILVEVSASRYLTMERERALYKIGDHKGAGRFRLDVAESNKAR